MMTFYSDPDATSWEWQVLKLAAVPRNEWGVIFLILVLIALGIAVLIKVIATEVYRVYKAHAYQKDTQTAKGLWTALAVFTLVCVASFLMVRSGNWGGFYLLSYGLLIFVLVVEGYDWHENRKNPQQVLEDNDIEIDELLQPWKFGDKEKAKKEE